MSEFDPIGYGELRAQVAALEKDVTELRSDVRTLLELANRSRGGLWVGMAIVSLGSAVVGWLANHVGGKS